MVICSTINLISQLTPKNLFKGGTTRPARVEKNKEKKCQLRFRGPNSVELTPSPVFYLHCAAKKSASKKEVPLQARTFLTIDILHNDAKKLWFLEESGSHTYYIIECRAIYSLSQPISGNIMIDSVQVTNLRHNPQSLAIYCWRRCLS